MKQSTYLVIVVLAGMLAAGSLPDAARGQPAEYEPFARTWSRHGFGLIVYADGYGIAGWRIYRWCSDDPTPPCDLIDDTGLITNGGRATIVFSHVEGDTAHGDVIESSDPGLLAPGPAALTLLPYGMALLIHGGREIELCGPDFVALAPEELRLMFPCGA